ncbi:MAG: hypothetical protein D6744_01705, partial [Planctomycetota bacterium]
PVKPRFNIITPNGVSHPFVDGPTGAGDIEVTWTYTYVHDFQNGDFWRVEGTLRKPGRGVIGRMAQNFPPGSQLIPDPPQPPGLTLSCWDAVPVSARKEAKILAAAGLPDNPGTEVWLVPSGDLTFWHPAAQAPEIVHVEALPAGGGPTELTEEFAAASETVQIGWSDDFEAYDPSLGLHGQGGWMGWDDDSAFDAQIVTNGRGGSQAVEVAGNTDIVRKLDLPKFATDSTTWTIKTWQYIPSDFTSGGNGGAMDGSYFVLLNNYEAGGAHSASDWSVQMQFDSNDGMLKVYNGNGLNTIDVPYIVDQWTPIEVVVDLEADTTRVFYDDTLITEYRWTAGALGAGGGQPEIAAVDLFAGGSSGIFYDDMVIMPMRGGGN